MRSYRIKLDHQSTWYHCYNRVAGTRLDRPFDEADREKFVQLLHRVATLYTVQVIAYQVMSNHFHLLVMAPQREPGADEMCRRYHAFHYGKKELNPDSAACRSWQARSRDISWFMRHLQHLFTAWFNRTRTVRRRGKLWADRFKHTLLESGKAVWACWKYIEQNPVRAGMVRHAADYRFCSIGRWHQSGRHPFADHLRETALPMLADLLGVKDLRDIRDRLDAALAEDEPETTSAGFTLHLRRRIRHWVDGAVIGSELFVRQVMAAHTTPERASRHRVATTEEALCAWRRVSTAT